ncbi:MAG: endonuclease V [Candidatus Eisenbacteria bacterium]
MAEVAALKDLRARELLTLKERVERRIKFKAAPKSIRRIAGIDIVLTPAAAKIHVCASLLSYPKLVVLEEAIATDELDDAVLTELGNVSLVPLVLSVLKMLKQKTDLIMIKELSLREELILASYVGVIAGRPSIGVSDRSSNLKSLSKWEGVKRAGSIKIRGHKTRVGVIAGHLVTFKDASALVKACAKETRMPEPVRCAGSRVHAWEREWRRVNLEGKRRR